MDFRRNKFDIQPFISGDSVERVSDFCFLGVPIMEDLTLGINTAEVVKKAQERLYFLCSLRKNNILQKLLLSFYHYSIECPNLLYVCVVHHLHGGTEEGIPEGHKGRPGNHRLPPPLSQRTT